MPRRSGLSFTGMINQATKGSLPLPVAAHRIAAGVRPPGRLWEPSG
ncbi:hypothetical protein [Embleya sp. NPDC005575]